jgi:tripartite-type tricarboxylate transporter receptor subunit TctC
VSEDRSRSCRYGAKCSAFLRRCDARARVGRAALAAVLAGSGGAAAQSPSYPAKPIRIVIPYVAGGAVDVIARAIGSRMHEAWGQPVLIDNRPGGGSNVGTEVVARSTADGHTLLATSSVIGVNASLYRKLPFDPVNDLAPVGLVVQIPNVLAVHPSLPARTMQELLKLARSRPGQIVYASSGTGSPTHLGMELLKSMARIDMLHVPYKGGGQSLPALIGGEAHAAFITLNAILPQGRAGRVRMLAVSSARRVELAPDLPTIAETGLAGFDVTPWYALFAPAATPRPVVAQLNGEINRILQLAEVRSRFDALGMVPLGGTPEALAEMLRVEIARWVKVIRDNGLVQE